MLGRSVELDAIGLALRRPDLVGAVLCGPPGTGKSTLLDVAATRAAEQGFEVIRLHANRATSTIPLFVFSTVLAGSEDVATVERFVAIRSALLERSKHRPLMLAIDDAHELDDASAVLVSQLARELTAFMLAATRTGEPTPDPIAALWTQGIALRVDIGPLGRDVAADFARSVLGGPIDPALEAEVWRRTSGNPLHIRELVHGSRAAGTLVLSEGVWKRSGDLVTSDALIDLVGQRVAGLAAAEQAALCAVALAEPAGVGLLEQVVDANALVALEEAGLIEVLRDRRRLLATIAHPVYGEVARTATSQLRMRQLRRDLAAAVTQLGTRRRDDLIQVAIWRLDAHDPDPALFAGAAFEAMRRHDIDLAERLALAAHDDQPSGLSARAVAMTRHLLGRHDEALDVLEETLDEVELDPAEEARIRLLQGLVLARGAGDYVAAIAALERIGEAASDRVRSRATAMLALIALLQGRAQSGLEAARRHVAGGATEAEAFTALVGTLAVTGRPATAADTAAAYVELVGEPDPRSLFPDFRWVALIDAGQIRTMEREVDEAWAIALDGGDRHRQARLALAMGHVHVDTGRLKEATAWFDRSASLSRSVGERFGVRWALCGQLLAAGQLADVPAADAALAGLAEIPGHPAELFEIYGRRGAAWADAAKGRTRQACDDLFALVQRLRADGCVSQAVRALVDAARLGDAARAGEAMAELRDDLDGAFLPLCVEYVTALAARDGGRLATASASFEELGYGALALAAAVAAREQLTRDGQRRDANAWGLQVKRLSLGSGAVAGLMLTADEPVVPLTRREREIAHLVANGQTSREVAEACFLSVRTVENHLARIYDKLGVRSRTDLAAAIRPLLAEGAA